MNGQYKYGYIERRNLVQDMWRSDSIRRRCGSYQPVVPRTMIFEAVA